MELAFLWPSLDEGLNGGEDLVGVLVGEVLDGLLAVVVAGPDLGRDPGALADEDGEPGVVGLEARVVLADKVPDALRGLRLLAEVDAEFAQGGGGGAAGCGGHGQAAVS